MDWVLQEKKDAYLKAQKEAVSGGGCGDWGWMRDEGCGGDDSMVYSQVTENYNTYDKFKGVAVHKDTGKQAAPAPAPAK